MPSACHQGPVSKPMARIARRVGREKLAIVSIGVRCGGVLARLVQDVSVMQRVSALVFVVPSAATLKHAAAREAFAALALRDVQVTVVLADEQGDCGDAGEWLPGVRVVRVAETHDRQALDMHQLGGHVGAAVLRGLCEHSLEGGELEGHGELVWSKVVLKEGAGPGGKRGLGFQMWNGEEDRGEGQDNEAGVEEEEDGEGIGRRQEEEVAGIQSGLHSSRNDEY